jgi:hypothetical protein
MFKILFILISILILLNITYGITHRYSRLTTSTIQTNVTTRRLDNLDGDYYDSYYYDTSNAYRHKLKINFIFFLIIFFFK